MLRHFSSMRDNALLRQVTITVLNKKTEKKLKRDKTTEEELLERAHPLDKMLRTVSDHSRAVLNRKYGLNCLGYRCYERIYRRQGS